AKVKTKDRELPLWVNLKAFKEDAGDAVEVLEIKVAVPPFPKKMTVGALLRQALAQTDLGAAYVVRHGVIEITTPQRATALARLNEAVEGKFESRPLDGVLEELAAQA